ncbi:MAG: ethanolamine ammonia-lyase subunit EutC [Myxococcales bacterium]|jgi:ethanolamine ammonia-lyase small subunit
MNNDELRRIVEQEIRRALEEASRPAPGPSPAAPATPPRQQPGVARWLRDGEPAPRPRPRPLAAPAPTTPPCPTGIDLPSNPEALQRFVAATPSRIGVGRAGTRYLTDTYLGLRADHAIAKDAVYSECAESFAQSLGCVPLKSTCKDKQEFLLFPAHGRRLDDESQARLAQEATKGVDVQLIVGDGLSAWAAERNAPELLALMQQELSSAGFSIGRPLFVRFARVGVQDHIGVLTGAKATVIMLGERPGLGTGDSLSVYIAYGPKLDQDNAEKNCISNVRALGIRPPEAARETCEVLRRAFAAGRGGVAA